MTIPHSRPTIAEDDIRSVAANLRTGLLATGEEVATFERDVSSYIGVAGAVAVNSGTSALHIALEALGVGPGDEVVIPSYVCASVLHAVECTGATPVVVDISSDGYNISPDAASMKITRWTKAIVVPHMFGTVAELDALSGLGRPIVEDCAQAIGASYNGRRVGSHGMLSMFSFKATKLMTTGHGGMVATNAQDLLTRLKELSRYDELDDYHVSRNYSLTDFQAALGRSQMGRLDEFVEIRQRIAATYDRVLRGIGAGGRAVGDGVVFRYVVEVEDAHAYVEAMRKHGVNCSRPVFKPLHRYVGAPGGFPNTERAMARALSIPIYPSLSPEELEHVCNSIEAVWRTQAKRGTRTP